MAKKAVVVAGVARHHNKNEMLPMESSLVGYDLWV